MRRALEILIFGPAALMPDEDAAFIMPLTFGWWLALAYFAREVWR